MGGIKGTVYERRPKDELKRIFYLIVRDDLDTDAVMERWGVAEPTARKWRSQAQRRAA